MQDKGASKLRVGQRTEGGIGRCAAALRRADSPPDDDGHHNPGAEGARAVGVEDLVRRERERPAVKL